MSVNPLSNLNYERLSNDNGQPTSQISRIDCPPAAKPEIIPMGFLFMNQALVNQADLAAANAGLANLLARRDLA